MADTEEQVTQEQQGEDNPTEPAPAEATTEEPSPGTEEQKPTEEPAADAETVPTQEPAVEAADDTPADDGAPPPAEDGQVQQESTEEGAAPAEGTGDETTATEAPTDGESAPVDEVAATEGEAVAAATDAAAEEKEPAKEEEDHASENIDQMPENGVAANGDVNEGTSKTGESVQEEDDSEMPPNDDKDKEKAADVATADEAGDNTTADEAVDEATVDKAGDEATVDKAGDEATVDKAVDEATVDKAGDEATVDKADGNIIEETEEKGEEAAEGQIEDGQEITAETVDDDSKEQGETAESQEEQLPKSDSFADGERAESPVAVGERLSREGTPEADEQMTPRSPPVILEPGTPENYGSEEDVHQMADLAEEDEEDDEYEEEEFQEFDREMLIEKYHSAISEREQLQQQNFQLQHKLAEYFRKKKADDTRQEMDKNVTDQEQRYLKYMSNLEDLRRQDSDQRDDFKHHIEDLKDKCGDRQEKVDEERDRFMEFKKQVALSSVNTRSGKQIPAKDIEMYLAMEAKKEAEVVNVRLENIKLKNKLKKKEMQLKSKEELAEGLHLIDFEQLKIENQTYNEKIEERNEELLKLRKKITSTVQVLTHLKEKLQYVQGENQVLKGHLRDIEGNVAQKRDILSRTKQARDALRIDNHKLRQNCGLLGNEPLLRDFEERKDEGTDLRAKLEKLKMTHAELTLSTNGFRRKIEQAKNAELM